jgi:UDP-N-acetylenolpyruvoylglucosamine reductase
MKTTNDVVLELIDRDAEAEDMEALIADIKATVYSPFQSEEMKVKFIKKAIEEAGF